MTGIDPRELTNTEHNVLDAIRLLEREAPRLIRSAAPITFELHQWGIDISYGNVQTVTRGLAEDGVVRKEKIDPNDPRREPKGLLPFEFTVTEEAREAIFDHLDGRLDMWGLDAADLFTPEEIRASFFE